MNDRNFDSEKVNIYFYHCTDLFYELDKRLGVAKDGYLFLSAEEILKGLEGKLNAQKILKERRGTGFVIKQIGNKVAVSTGVSPKDLHEREATKEITQFEGSPAYKGLVRGKVKVVLGTGLDAEKFKKRDILVTPMTTPKFIPFIKQASAVITDEGGLLCHAAIISRELKTPCIIGTKIATKVLKDEDLIEVDANRGIVKILKRSK
ncbi:MAG: hypothetical protein HY764_01475 [Candidatus Portnoybacteria bacterium]|nr:hypothetical protein [Candidatus Portnoybacteria bacterium]